MFIISYLLHVLVCVTPYSGGPFCYLLKNCMFVTKSITCSKTVYFIQKSLLAQKLYALCKRRYLLKKTICFMQKALLAKKNYMLYTKSITC